MSTSSFRPDADCSIKIVILGDVGVGKSALIQRFIHNTFDAGSSLPTIALDTLVRTDMFGRQNRRLVRAVFWDTAGQERFRSLSRQFYSGAHAFVIVYDASEARSPALDQIKSWLRELATQCPDSASPIIIVGNKADLLTSSISESPSALNVATASAVDHCGLESTHVTMCSSPVSACTGVGVHALFTSLLDTCVDRFASFDTQSPPPPHSQPLSLAPMSSPRPFFGCASPCASAAPTSTSSKLK